MMRWLCAGALALAVFSFVPGFTATASASESTTAQPRINIARIRSVLRLTPEQQPYWPPVEAALRRLARAQSQQPQQQEGLMHRVSQRVYAVALDAASIARIGAAARPLVRVLDERQKQDAISLCHEMGLGPVLAALI